MNVLAAELHNISPAAYRMLRNCGSVVLRRVKLIKQLLSNSFHDQNDEVKPTETVAYSGCRVVGYAEDVVYHDKVLATHALEVEVVFRRP